MNPSLAFLASNSEIKIRVTAKAATAAEARLLIEPMEAEVVSRLGEPSSGRMTRPSSGFSCGSSRIVATRSGPQNR